ncbi:MAG: hypothetical protein Q4Q14_07630 [Methanobrevibacter sp.]|nr:hypothetical protein [Methanobrevibacter sp.]
MFDYNIEDAQRILKSFDSVDLRFDDHMLDNWFERKINFDYVFNCLKNEMILSISKTSENRFKLIYPHEKLKTKDLYVIIEIDDFEKITVKTAYTFSKSRRQRENERK